MRRRNRDWPERVPRPKLARLPQETLEKLHATAVKFVEKSDILREVVETVQVARGRLYFMRAADDLLARITPLDSESMKMLLETQHRNSWVEHKRGLLSALLKFIEKDEKGTFHGLGSLVAKKSAAKKSVQVVLHRDLKIPIAVVAEPRHWYQMHRKPVIAEISDTKDRALVRFVASGMSGSFYGTCLYALRDGEWECYTVKPSASATIAAAEMWLNKRGWDDWG